MRLAAVVLVALLLSSAARSARADDYPPPQPHHHTRTWYAGWSAVIGGGAAALVGVALTTRSETAVPATGWALAGVGTATWVAGALVLKLNERRVQQRKSAAQ
ncbi:MAG TPA: hypothetical protein VGL86_14515 [Polyangia bacterium]|jgi:hypothetical protein